MTISPLPALISSPHRSKASLPSLYYYTNAVSLEYNLSFTDFILLLSEVEMLLNVSSPVCQNENYRLNKHLSKKLQVELNERKCYNKKQLGKKL